ncbi:DUF3867 domain-containing protein [Clostridium senegalense]|uniref:DUF3867 domain-containing protein n=1 Tax=Clostridium senegalense TaxID=1465809 RepID=UPI000289C62E|nr:DUF3867 domain-containing protein [Clostridium senegalense]
MSDIINFNELKTKASDKDIDKFENYIYELYYSMSQGKMNISDFTKSLKEYMDKNSISNEKLMNIQKKLMERYGFNSEDLQNQMKDFGVDLNSMGLGNITEEYESLRKTISFQEKYQGKTKNSAVMIYKITNDINDLDVLLEQENVILRSSNKIDIQDIELNEFLCSYKKLLEGKTLKISICENAKEYEY